MTLKSVLKAFLVVLALYSSSCKISQSSQLETSDSGEVLADLKWIDRAARALRLGKGLNQDDPLRQMVQKPKSEVIDILMKEPIFTHTMVDFYAYYYGMKQDDSLVPAFINNIAYNPVTKVIYKSDNCQSDSNCSPYLKSATTILRPTDSIQGHPAALNGALAVAQGSSLQVMYQFDQPRYLSLSQFYQLLYRILLLPEPGSMRSGSQDQSPKPKSLPQLEQRMASVIAKKSNLARDLLAAHLKGPQQKSEVISGFCGEFVALDSPEEEDVLGGIRDLVNFDQITALCFGKPKVSTKQVREIIAYLDKGSLVIKSAFGFMEQILTSKAPMMDSGVVKIPANLEINPTSNIFSQTFWQSHPNSSTNFNRKRAAYVFKTFFCDDLTPVKLEVAANPGDTRHGTDASCAACHYKLDPMAGFFRSYGVIGFNFGTQPQSFIFDDAKVIQGDELKKYWASWDFPAKKGPNQGLNIGMVRSATNLTSNTYGNGLEDFGKLLASDRRTYTCTTQRLAEYFLGKGSTLDRQWIEEQAQIIQRAPAVTSGKAVQQVIKNLLMSRTFSQQNPVEGTCYDRSSKSGPSSLDCQVASTLDQYCTKCHGSSGDQGGLNLSSWTSERGFSHLDEGGKQISRNLSYERILDRLGPSDEGPIMPLNSSMPDPDRLILKKWFEGQIANTNKAKKVGP